MTRKTHPPVSAAKTAATVAPVAAVTQTMIAPVRIVPERRTFWKKMGGRSLGISLFFHLILVVICLFWVLKVVRPPDKKVDFMPKSGGGGSPASESKEKQHRVKMLQPNMARIAAVGATSNMILPDQDDMSAMTSLGSISQGGLSSGLGGSGSGGGNGTGNGTGTGDGMGAGLGGGGFKNPFGMVSMDKNALVGTFYDLKQTKDGKPTGFTEVESLKVLSDFTTRGNWNTKALEKYYKAPNTLYQTKLYIPIMSASLAPDAFGCGKEVQPVHWVALYRGMITPPKSGKFRFVGRADNVMVVRFNSKVVLDGGDYSACVGRQIWDRASISVLNGTSGNREQEREMRRGGYEIPVKSYTYPTSGQYNERGGVMVGKDIVVREGQKYPVEILLSELGGLFGAALMIEEDQVQYQKDASGSPILPLFRLDGSLPAPSTEQRGSPPFDPTGPVWKVVPGDIIGNI